MRSIETAVKALKYMAKLAYFGIDKAKTTQAFLARERTK